MTTVGATGEVITQFNSIEAFSRSMLISLPIAMALALLISGLVLRSVRYGIAAVIPIGFVVTGVYAFMYLAGYKINVITAMIATIAVGVGIDFSTHFTARFREELAVDGHRLEALRRTGVGTGGALILSATTSVLGFTVMAFAPMSLFATFGVLTAVMIALALAASLLVLLSVLALLTPRTANGARSQPLHPTTSSPNDSSYPSADPDTRPTGRLCRSKPKYGMGPARSGPVPTNRKGN